MGREFFYSISYKTITYKYKMEKKKWKENGYSLTNDYKDGDVTHLGVGQWHKGWVCSSYIAVATCSKFCVALAGITWGTSRVGSRP